MVGSLVHILWEPILFLISFFPLKTQFLVICLLPTIPSFVPLPQGQTFGVLKSRRRSKMEHRVPMGAPWWAMEWWGRASLQVGVGHLMLYSPYECGVEDGLAPMQTLQVQNFKVNSNLYFYFYFISAFIYLFFPLPLIRMKIKE